MKITVVRSGGFAGLSRTWAIRLEDQPDREQWDALIDELPWNERAAAASQPDRFMYRIRVSRRQIVLPEQKLQGPWRELVDRVRQASLVAAT